MPTSANWHFGTHSLGWQLGKSGKGNVYSDDSVETWDVDSNGKPHHSDRAQDAGLKPVFLFYISPDGGVSDGGLGYNNSSSRSDDQNLDLIAEADPKLHKGSEYDLLDVPSRRIELPEGGWGHAQNILDRFSSEDYKKPEDELYEFLRGFSAPDAQSISPHHNNVGDLFAPSAIYDWQKDGDF